MYAGGSSFHAQAVSLGSEEGQKVFYAKVKDRLGNESTVQSVTLYYDKANPVVKDSSIKSYSASIANPAESDKASYNAANPYYKGGTIIEVAGKWQQKVLLL